MNHEDHELQSQNERPENSAYMSVTITERQADTQANSHLMAATHNIP